MTGIDVISVLGPEDRNPRPFIDDLLGQAGPLTQRIILVDDGCSEEVAQMLASADGADERVEILRIPRHLGRLRASNLALAHTDASIVVFVDPDVRLGQNWINQVEACMEPGADVTMVGSPEVPGESVFAVSRRAIEVLDGFDPVFGAGGGERTDFAMRARYEGLRLASLDLAERGVRGGRRDAPKKDLPEANRRVLTTRWRGMEFE